MSRLCSIIDLSTSRSTLLFFLDMLFAHTFKPAPLKQLILFYLVLFPSVALTSNQKSAALQSYRGEMASEGMDVFCNSEFWVSHSNIFILVYMCEILNEFDAVPESKARRHLNGEEVRYI